MIPVLFRSRGIAFALGCWSFVALGWAGLLVASLAREVEAGFGQDDVGLGFYYFVTAIVYAAGSALGGIATERVGRRLVYAVAVALLGVGLIAQGLAGDWGLFLVTGIVRSVGSGAIDGGGNGLVLDLYHDTRGGRLNLLHLFFSVGALGAPFVLAARGAIGLSWQAVTIGSGVVVLPLAVLLAVTDLADGRAQPNRRHDGARSSLIALPLVVLAIAIGCYVASEVGVSNWLVRFLAAAPAATATSALGLFWAGLAVGRLTGSRIADRFDHVALGVAASLVAGIALVGAVLVPSLEASIVLFALVGFASGPIYPLIVAIAGERFPDRAAAVSGVIVAASVVGAVVYPPLMGVMSVTVGLPVAMLGTAVVCVVCAAGLALTARMPLSAGVVQPR